MGNITGTTPISYTTKDNLQISYIYYDLKGYNRFPPLPQNQLQIQRQFDVLMTQINMTFQERKVISQFNSKYKFRFIKLHQRKLEQLKKMKELKNQTNSIDSLQSQKQQAHKRQTLDLKLKNIQLNESEIIMAMTDIQKYLTDNSAYKQFIQVRGIQRIVVLLNKTITNNLKGSGVIFTSQIQLLKFLKNLSQHIPTQYYNTVSQIYDYCLVLLRGYHPISIGISAYCLTLLQQYAWKVQNSRTFVQCLQVYMSQTQSLSFLDPFVYTLYDSNNILMVYYNLRFVNQVYLSIVDQNQKKSFQQQLKIRKYQLLLQDIKNNIQDNYYQIKNSSFQVVYQNLRKHIGQKQQKQLNQQRISTSYEQRISISYKRVSLQDLHQQILGAFAQTINTILPETLQQETDDRNLTVYLAQNDRKNFNKFLLDTFTQIQHYYKYTILVDESGQDIQSFGSQTQNLKKSGLSIQDYLKRIKGNSIKNDCQEVVLNCFKTLQYFDKKDWERFQGMLAEDMNKERGRGDVGEIKRKLQERERELRLLKKDMFELKNKIADNNIIDQANATIQTKSVQSTIVQQPKNSISTLTNSDSLILPALPPPPINILPSLVNQILPQLPIGLLPPPIVAPFLPIPILGPATPVASGLIFSNQKLKQKRSPKVPLKACNYVPIPHSKISNSIWQKIDESKIELNLVQLQEMFTKTVLKQQSNTQSTDIASIDKKQTIKLLSPDRYRNFQIVLTKLKLPQKAITDALTLLQGKYATISIMQSVSKLLPTQDQQAAIRSFQGNSDDMGKPQKFIKEIISVPQYSHRIKAFLFAQTKDQIYFDLQKNIQDLTIAFKSIKQNTRLHYALQVALAIGNYLNGQGLKGGAWGFKLQSLQRIQQVKSADSKMNVGFYLIRQIWKKYTYPVFDKFQLQKYQYITHMPTGQIKLQLAQIKNMIKSLQKAIKSKQNTHKDNIQTFCSHLLQQAERNYQNLKQKTQKLQQIYIKCAQFYCQDHKIAPSDQIGKKIFKSVLFLFTTQKVFYEMELRRKKEMERKVPVREIKYKGDGKVTVSISNQNKSNSTGQAQPTLNISQSMVKLFAVPPTTSLIVSQTPTMSAKQRLKYLEQTQESKQKKYVDQMIKKRASKVVAYRQSKMNTTQSKNNLKIRQSGVDFLKNLKPK